MKSKDVRNGMRVRADTYGFPVYIGKTRKTIRNNWCFAEEVEPAPSYTKQLRKVLSKEFADDCKILLVRSKKPKITLSSTTVDILVKRIVRLNEKHYNTK